MAGHDEKSLSRAILDSAAVLSRGSESVGAVMNAEENRFSRALSALQTMSETEGFPIAIVGGLAAIRYGYPAATQDIDIVVARDKVDLLLKAASRYGLNVVWETPSGRQTLLHGDVEINVVPEGGKARDSSPTTIPGPVMLGVTSGLDYASLPGWIELKLSSGRQKDRAHIVEVMKKTADETIRSARNSIAAVHQSYLKLFDQLWDEALEERAQEDAWGAGDVMEAASAAVSQGRRMYDRFTDRARKVLQLANQQAQRFEYDSIRSELILLALLREGWGVASEVLLRLNFDPHALEEQVEQKIPQGPKFVPGRLPQSGPAKKVLEQAIEEARNFNHNYVGTEHLLLGLIRDTEGLAGEILKDLGLNLDTVRAEVLKLLGQIKRPENTDGSGF